MHRPYWLRRKDKSPSLKGGSIPLIGPSIEQIVPSETASDHQDDKAVTKSLWERAYTELRICDNTLVDRFEKVLLSEDPEHNETTSREEQLSRIIEEKLALMEREKWVINVTGKSIKVRKQIKRVVKVVRMTKDSLSIVANIDPIHLGVPVAAVCLLTSVSWSWQTD